MDIAIEIKVGNYLVSDEGDVSWSGDVCYEQVLLTTRKNEITNDTIEELTEGMLIALQKIRLRIKWKPNRLTKKQQ